MRTLPKTSAPDIARVYKVLNMRIAGPMTKRIMGSFFLCWSILQAKNLHKPREICPGEDKVLYNDVFKKLLTLVISSVWKDICSSLKQVR